MTEFAPDTLLGFPIEYTDLSIGNIVFFTPLTNVPYDTDKIEYTIWHAVRQWSTDQLNEGMAFGL